MYYVVWPCLEYCRDGTVAMKPQSPIPWMQIAELKSAEDAETFKNQKQRNATPGMVTIFEGRIVSEKQKLGT